MHIISALAGALLIGIAVYKIVTAARQDKQPDDGPVIFRLIGEQIARDEPVVIKRIVGSRGNGEPITVNRAPAEDNSVPWVTRRNGEGAETYFEWQWKDRTEDDPGDAYYERRPSRWWEFKKLSSRSDGNTERIYERK